GEIGAADGGGEKGPAGGQGAGAGIGAGAGDAAGFGGAAGRQAAPAPRNRRPGAAAAGLIRPARGASLYLGGQFASARSSAVGDLSAVMASKYAAAAARRPAACRLRR